MSQYRVARRSAANLIYVRHHGHRGAKILYNGAPHRLSSPMSERINSLLCRANRIGKDTSAAQSVTTRTVGFPAMYPVCARLNSRPDRRIELGTVCVAQRRQRSVVTPHPSLPFFERATGRSGGGGTVSTLSSAFRSCRRSLRWPAAARADSSAFGFVDLGHARTLASRPTLQAPGALRA